MAKPDPETPDFLPGTLYLLILRALRAGKLHGYAIARRIKQTSGDCLVIEEGSLYPALNRMLVKGWVKAEWGTSESNRKARFYELTPLGAAELERQVQQFENVVRAISLVIQTA